MNRVLRAMIVDDEPPAREGLRLRLKREADVVIIGEFGEAARALDAIREDAPDILFLDVEMPGLDGFSLVEAARDISLPPIVFVTAHDAHAVKAFGVRALDYLLKPVEQERLHEAVERAREYWEKAENTELAQRVKSLVGGAAGLSPRENSIGDSLRIPVRQDGAIRLVNASDVDWIDAAGDSVRLHVGNTRHLIRKSMSEMTSMLDPSRFIRIHRSTIVNIDRVKELQPYFHGEYIVVLQNGAKLKLSRGYRESLDRLIGKPEKR
jgi:two-component system LytT family response regulator